MTVKELITKYEPYMVEMRRELHQHPEISLQEEWTSARICQELESAGISYQVVGHRNVVGVVDSGKPGRSIAIRADFDALPMDELVDLPYKSKIKGAMHSCGHDAHTATLLGCGKVLNDLKDSFNGKVYLCFQIAEEVGAGADEIVAYLKEQGGVDEAIAVHVLGAEEVGTMVLPDGAMYAGNMGFKVTVKGVGGHGSRPDLAVDPLRPACDILLKIQAIPVNRHDPFETVVISPCMINGGTKNNIIPEACEIEGNIRFFRVGEGEELVGEIARMAEQIAAAYGATVEVSHSSMALYPVVNTAESAQRGRALAKELGLTVLAPPNPNLASDNFADFLQAFGGFYASFGAHSHRPGTSGNHHNPTFDMDEAAMPLWGEFLSEYAYRFLQ
ncbi:M20 family metallopeptidase [Neobittarella massiliensis]|uniref:M20 metallopeptidase family protein n=1 Tax=Neobittarella massiliensis (ex Bilen et al. 2018) TaxID=2041842 RepID=UPI000CF6E885|nr:M20 family metallopeptidase [Neobittarella massiliensis]